MFGLGAPLAAGLALGNPGLGTAAALGALAVSGAGEGEGLGERAKDLGQALAAGSLAAFAGYAFGGRGITTACLVPLVAATGGLLGGLSRPLARAAARFILFFIIAAHLGLGEAGPFAVLLFLLGGAWTAGLTLAFRPLVRFIAPKREIPPPQENTGKPSHPFRILFPRWKKTLRGLAGWHYVLRLLPSLAAAEAFDLLFAGRHGYWAVLTAGILIRRDLGAAHPKILRRAAGTALGVLAAGLLLASGAPVWALALAVSLLAAARLLLKETNYAAYSAAMTILVLVLLDLGSDPSWNLLLDRLLATLAGCVLALSLGNPAPWRRFSV